MASKQTPTTDNVAPKTKSTAATDGGSLPQEARWRRTAIAAFYRAQARGFLPGGELDDWLEAEREVDAADAAAAAAGDMQPTRAASGFDAAQRAEQASAKTAPDSGAGTAGKRARSRRGKSVQGGAKRAGIQARDRGDVSR